VLLHVLRIARARLGGRAPSAFYAELVAPLTERHLAQPFVTLREEIRLGVAHHGYFEHVLWPRLLALTAGRPGASPALPPGRLLRRGPSLATLDRVIGEIEDQP
jgi:hypothetical protein